MLLTWISHSLKFLGNLIIYFYSMVVDQPLKRRMRNQIASGFGWIFEMKN